MKRGILIAIRLAAALFVVILLLLRYWVVPSEGFPTWEAVRNILIREGEISVTLPEGVEVVTTSGEHVSADGKTITTKAGYGSFVITVEARIEGRTRELRFQSLKLNNWNRIRFEPIDPGDPHSGFRKFENGVEKPIDVSSP